VISVDTNILARFYLEEDESLQSEKTREQQKIAARLMSKNILVTRSVMLEFHWLMKGFYKLPKAIMLDIMDNLPNATVENEDVVVEALGHYKAGLQFADALHLAASHDAKEFATFDDQTFARRAKRLGLKPICMVPR